MTECILQRNLTTSADLSDCIAVATLIDGHKYFMTPQTANDGQWWKNGLDDQVRIEDSVKFFDSTDSAIDHITSNQAIRNSFPFHVLLYKASISNDRIILSKFKSLTIEK